MFSNDKTSFKNTWLKDLRAVLYAFYIFEFQKTAVSAYVDQEQKRVPLICVLQAVPAGIRWKRFPLTSFKRFPLVFDGSGFRSDAASAYEFEEIAVSAYSFFCLAVSAYSVFLLEDATISASSFFGAASVHVKPKMQRPPLILSLFSGFVVVTRKSYSSIFHVARMPAAPQRVLFVFVVCVVELVQRDGRFGGFDTSFRAESQGGRHLSDARGRAGTSGR